MVIKLMAHIEATDSWVPMKTCSYRTHRLAAHDAAVRELVLATPDATLDDLVEEDLARNARR